MIAWDNNIKKNGRFVPLEPDKTTPHKHYESNSNPTSTSTPTTPATTPTTTQPATATKDESIAKISEALTEIRKLANTVVVAVDLLQARLERQ